MSHRRCGSRCTSRRRRASGAVPVLYYLAGLTCTEETFMIKAGAQRLAAELGLMLVAPDTSPRAAAPAGRRRELGFRARRGLLRRCDAGAVGRALPDVQLRDARAAGARRRELSGDCRAAVASSAIRWAVTARSSARCAIPRSYRSVSAFAPICGADRRCPWGEKAFTGYLGRRCSGSWADTTPRELVAHARVSRGRS